MRKEYLMKLRKIGILAFSAAITLSAASCGANNKDKDTSVEETSESDDTKKNSHADKKADEVEKTDSKVGDVKKSDEKMVEDDSDNALGSKMQLTDDTLDVTVDIVEYNWYGDYMCSMNSDNTVRIWSYKGKEKDVVIPGEIEGMPVTQLNGTFLDNNMIESVVIPDSVTYIGDYTFKSCTKLKNIDCSGKLNYIGDFVFYNCDWLKNQPEGVVYLANFAVGYNGDMLESTKLTLKDGTEGIGVDAFKYISNLVSVDLPEGLKIIEDCAFHGCENLKEINIPDSVEYIEENPVVGTAWYDEQADGVVYLGNFAIDYKGNMPKNYKLELKKGTKGICKRAFKNYDNIIAVENPEGVTYIGYEAFSSVDNLEKVNIPNTVKKIEMYAFDDCENLKEIYVPESVTEISYYSLGYIWCCDDDDEPIASQVKDFVISGKSGSAAEKYAKDNSFTFKIK